MMSTKKKTSLGRGLDAILESPETDITSKDISGNYVVGAIAEIELKKIEANPFQPRDEFEEKSLLELAESIREQGVIQPVTVRKLGYDRYQLISGERRFRACKIIGKEKIPAYLRLANDEQMLELALIENIHRKELNALEIAISYKRLMDELDLSQNELSQKLGKDRTTIINYVRLLNLNPQIQMALKENQVSMGHARSLLSIEDEKVQLKVLKKIIGQNLSVRETEKIARELKNKTPRIDKNKEDFVSELDRTLVEKMTHVLGVNVKLKKNNINKGSIVIPFNSEEDLRRLSDILDK